MSEERFDYNVNGNEDGEENNGATITSFKQLGLLMGGFFGILFLMFIVSKIPSLAWTLGILFGLLFIGGGVLFLKGAKKVNMLPILLIIIGSASIVLTVISKFVPDIKEKYGTQMFSIGAICLGLFVLGYPIIELIHAKTKYKEIVEATVVRVDSRRSHGKHHTRTYRPVYEFTYSGRTYTVKEDVFTSGRHPMVGEIRDLAIDENDPEVFYDFRSMSQKLVGTSVFGVAAIAVGVIIMVMA